MPLQRLAFQPEARSPLRGIRVLDFARLAAGNMLSLQLADFGAEVVKIEEPRHGDTLRNWKTQGQSLHWKVYSRNNLPLLEFISSNRSTNGSFIACGDVTRIT